eukprot:GABV01000616.1.p1 GENE.GABV01000616.1~~GABV01000616.1.p1  ORF type:complete len:203 (-),score=87.67 GABV01000616.1:176-784(-)
MRVRDFEMELPLPEDPENPGKPQLDKARRAWWAIINLVHELADEGKYPMRLALEARITHDSQVLLAPQYGNQWGTFSIEVLTPVNVDNTQWTEFMQQVFDRWQRVDDEFPVVVDDRRVPMRPHWAKQWSELMIPQRVVDEDGKVEGEEEVPAVDFYRNLLWDTQIRPFREQLAIVAAGGGYSIDEMFARFGNKFVDRWLKEE